MSGWAEVAARGRRAARAAVDRGRTGTRVAGRVWRTSLQVRVVTITLLVSALLVVAFSYLVAQQITAGLIRAKVHTAVQQIDYGRTDVQGQLGALSGVGDPQLDQTVSGAVYRLANLPPRAGTFDVLLVPDPSIEVAPAALPHRPEDIAVPAELRHQVRVDRVSAYQFTQADPDGRGMRPYLAVGAPVNGGWGQFELYYLFPLDDEVHASTLVRNTLIVTGAALVLLLALIAGIVTRLVVTPVRVAARTAQRLSAGLLHERMAVRGEDDLARLAASFNQMADNLQRQIVQLEDLSRLQRRFTSDVSHELRTPLTTVRMAADMLHMSRDTFAPAAARSAELLQAELDRFEALLNDLLEISRFDAGFAVLEAEPSDLVPIVRRAVEGLIPLAERVGSRIELDLPAGPVIAEVDPRRIERIVRNLVGNALEHGERRPVRVTLTASGTADLFTSTDLDPATDLDLPAPVDRPVPVDPMTVDQSTAVGPAGPNGGAPADDPAGAVAITVRDLGIGLRPGEEKLVFNRFWRSDPSRARQTGGTGLGLSISLEDARLHGGWLEAWGARGQGAQFRLTVPVRAGDRLERSPVSLVPADAAVDLDNAAPDLSGGPSDQDRADPPNGASASSRRDGTAAVPVERGGHD